MQTELTLAIEHVKAKRFDQARLLFRELHTKQPDDAQVNYHYARLHDSLGEEAAAAPLYERAVALGLPDEDLREALLCLGSTYRCIGEHEKAVDTLRTGLARFPDIEVMAVFLAMALYNIGKHREAMELLLRVITRTSNDNGIQRYRRAIDFTRTS